MTELDTIESPRSQEWRAGRSAYQRQVALNRRKLLDFIREHPNSTAGEILEATGHGVSSVNKFVIGQQDANRVTRYRALTLVELIEKDKQMEKKYALQKWA